MRSVRLKMMTALGAGLLVVVSIGCQGGMGGSAAPISRPSSPLERRGIEKVAVVMLNATQNAAVNELEFAQIFSTELQQFSGVKVFPAAVVEAAVRNNQLVMPQQAADLGRLLNVDAVMVGFVTTYDSYDTPSVGVLMLVYDVTAKVEEVKAVEATEETETGTPTEGQADAALKPIVTLERVYDSDQRWVMADVEKFARERGAGDGPLGVRNYTLVMSNYLHFVSDRMIRDLFKSLR